MSVHLKSSPLPAVAFVPGSWAQSGAAVGAVVAVGFSLLGFLPALGRSDAFLLLRAFFWPVSFVFGANPQGFASALPFYVVALAANLLVYALLALPVGYAWRLMKGRKKQ